MSNSRSSHITVAPAARPAGGAPAAPAPEGPAAAARGPVRAWVDFWFNPTDPVGLHVVRVLAGLLFLAWLLPFAGDVEAFFGLRGWLDAEALRAAGRNPAEMPVPIGWSLLYLCGDSPALLTAFYWLSILVLLLFTAGLWTRPTSVLTWLIVVSFAANPATSYGGDALLNILAFYLMAGYLLLGQWGRDLSVAERILGPNDTFLGYRWLPGQRSASAERPPSSAANAALRLIQVHFAIVIVASTLHKLQFGEWWSGVAYWYPLHPPFETTRESIAAEASGASTTLFLISLVQYVALGWQLGFPAFAWRRGWRPLLLAGGVVYWLASTFLWKQPLFGPVIFIACVSYVTAAEWHVVGAWLSRFVGTRESAERPRAARAAVKVGSKS